MSCSPYDLRDYLFDELTASQRGEVRGHLTSCTPCSSELQELRLTHTTLLALHEEEIPQRIGFVSDKVFEPSPVRRWLAGFWTSAARIGFVSSAVFAAALFVHDVTTHNHAQIAQSAQADLDARIQSAVRAGVAASQAKFQSQLATAVTQAVAETDQRAQKRTTDLLAAAQRKHESDEQSLRLELTSYLRYLTDKQHVATVRASYSGGGQ